MFRRTRETNGVGTAQETRVERGASLARGPALLLGTILLAAGLYFLYKQGTFTRLGNFPNGDAPVRRRVLFGIFGVNGWTGELTAVGGGLLLFGAAQHLLAKTMSLIVGVALGAAAIIAAISGNVLGLAAANSWTKIGWGVAAIILLFNTLIPRRRREVVVPATTAAGTPAATGATTGGGTIIRRRSAVNEPAAETGAAEPAVAEPASDRDAESRV